MPRRCIRSGLRSRGCAPPWRFSRRSWSMRNGGGWIRQGPWLARYKRRKHAEALQPYCARELNRWRERLVRKGRHLKTLGASRRHRLRIKAKRFRYMLEALTKTVTLGGRGEFHHL